MTEITDFRSAMQRLNEIGKELLPLKHSLLSKVVGGPLVREVILEPTMSGRSIKKIRIILQDGKELTLRASGIESVLVQVEGFDTERIRILEEEWKTINTKWYIYPS